MTLAHYWLTAQSKERCNKKRPDIVKRKRNIVKRKRNYVQG